MMVDLEAPSFQRFNADGSLLSAGSISVDISVLTFAPSQSYAGAAAAVLICSIVFMLLVLYVMLEDCRFPPRCDRSHQLRVSFATIPPCALG